MNKKTKPQISAAMTAAGVLTNYYSLLDKTVSDLGGQPEDLYPLGKQGDPEVSSLVKATAERLVARGRASRATRPKLQPLASPSMMFKPLLHPKYLFILPKDGADAPTLISRMEPTYVVSSYAKGMMEQKEFIIGRPETAVIGVFNCEQLEVVGWTEPNFFGPKGWAHIKKFRLAKSVPDDGQYIRQAHPDQELGEWFRVSHDPIPFDGCSRVWRIGHVTGGGRYLDGWSLHTSRRLRADDRVALRLA